MIEFASVWKPSTVALSQARTATDSAESWEEAEIVGFEVEQVAASAAAWVVACSQPVLPGEAPVFEAEAVASDSR